MFEVDVAGLAELEGGENAHRLAFEPVANVFDEFRGYSGEDRKKPSYCAVTVAHSLNPRGVYLTVADDGPGFANERDIWTFFGTTGKRSETGVSGRFNAGEKQLIALAREATIKTNSTTVEFKDGKRDVTRHRSAVVEGTIIQALLPWSVEDSNTVRESLKRVIPPDYLIYSVDGDVIQRPVPNCTVAVSLPTVILLDGVLRDTIRKTTVNVLFVESEDTPWLYELGIPVCSLEDVGFPWSLDVQQKIPVPLSRDSVTPKYLFRLIGSVVEAAAMDGKKLLSEEQQGAGFIREALEWVRNQDALKITVTSLFGENAVRQSSDGVANAQATLAGASVISGRLFSPATRARLDAGKVLPTSRDVYGGSDKIREQSATIEEISDPCTSCGGSGRVPKKK